MSGLQLQATLRAAGSPIPIIFITVHDDTKLRVQAMTAGAVEFLSKPVDDEVLLETVRAVLRG
jgi:FixJ family two-component response regulator